jgi:hypothetical protein
MTKRGGTPQLAKDFYTKIDMRYSESWTTFLIDINDIICEKIFKRYPTGVIIV